jgi:translation initiation factor IF-3
LEAAYSRGLDLVEVAPGARPPVCRIMDYGKYQYEQSKKAKEAKKKQHVIQLKEIKLTPKTEEHDLNFKLDHARKFLDNGNKVKFTVRFRGRQLAHKDFGRDKLDYIISELEDVGVVEKKPFMEGRNLVAIIGPKSQK